MNSSLSICLFIVEVKIISAVGSRLSQQEFVFKVRFKPRFSWVDKVYLGNLLIEALGLLARQSGAFEFDVEVLEKSEKG